MKIVLALLFLLLTAGCSSKHRDIVAVAWSDDGQEIAFLERSYKTGYRGVARSTFDIKYRIGVTDREGGHKEYITDFFEGNTSGSTFQELFYKSNMGYVVAKIGKSGFYTETNANEPIGQGTVFTDRFDYHIFDMSGNLLHSISKKPNEYCRYYSGLQPSIRVMPSQSGRYLAVSETTSDCELDVRILDFNDDFAVIDSQRFAGVTSVGMFWINESQLFVNTCLGVVCEDNWVLVRPGVEALLLEQELFNRLCLDGIVISGDINSAGERIIWNSPEGALQIEDIRGDLPNSLNWKMISIDRELNDPENCVYIE